MTSAGYTALTEAIALFEEPRAVFELRGERARRIVNGLVTNALDGLDRGTGCYAFALTAKGRPIADLRVLPAPGFEEVDSPGSGEGRAGGERLWIDAPAAAAKALRELFSRTVPPIFATVEELDVRRISLVGPGEDDPGLVEDCGIRLDRGRDGTEEPLMARSARWGPSESGPAGLLVAREAIEAHGWDLYLPGGAADRLRTCLAERVRAAGGAWATPADWEIVRVERGLPVFGAEISGENLPQETGQADRAISFRKGCYTGQEVVARIHYRGHVNRLLRGLRAVGPAAQQPFEPGEALERDGRDVGRVVTAAESPRLGSIGLAYIRREVEPGARLSRTAPRGEAEVVALPFTET